MGLQDLVTSQLTEDSQTASNNNVMDNQGASEPYSDGSDVASSTATGNVDGNGNVDGTELDPNAKAVVGMQKRINELTARAKTAEEMALQEKSSRETLERNFNTNSQPQTLADLDVNGLNNFIAKAQNNPDLELEQHIPEAQTLLQRRLVEEQISQFKEEQLATQNKTNGEQLTNILVNKVSDGRLNDENSPYFQKVQTYLNDLNGDQFQHVDAKYTLATALAEVDYLRAQLKGPNMTPEQRIVNNRNNSNKVMANNRAAGAGGGDLASYLSENKQLTRSSISKNGSLRGAINQLKAVSDL